MTISATMVKDLREKTGAGMMDCKKALAETNGNFDEAVDWLRKKGLSAAAKKSSRVAADGLVALHCQGTQGAVIELNAETDFVARNEAFQALVSGIAEVALASNGSVESILAAKFPSSMRVVSEEITHNIATIGENMHLRRTAKLAVTKGVVTGYIHMPIAAGKDMGKIAVLVALESAAPQDKLAALAKQLAMHIAAARPSFLSRDEVPAEAVERERNVLTEQARAEGRKEEIIVKMVEGRLKKFYQEVALLEQTFVIDNETRIETMLENQGKALGAAVKLSGFLRYELGEGVEKKETDFAAEVAAAVGAA